MIICDAIVGDDREILEAGHVGDALKMIKSHNPDIILSDIFMPGLSGIDFLVKIKELGVTIPVIIISADLQDAVFRECMKLGAVAYIPKPLEGDSLAKLNAILVENFGKMPR